MAEIAPFRGILYDTNKVDASAVLAPPYDVIDSAGRAALAERDAKNCVRLILPEGEGDAKYGAAAEIWKSWQAEGTLQQDERPALYRYHQVFTSAELGGREVTRKGFVAAVRLHQFAERVILPHERTLKGPKVDRLKLMGATSAHFSQIFTMYSDPEGAIDQVFAKIEAQTPVLDGTTADGTRHIVWRADDPEVIAAVTKQLAETDLYIADGHHRYETMLALRGQMREQHGGSLDARSAGEFGTLFLSNMDDPGLVVLPTHRLVHSVDGFDAGELMRRIGDYFDSETLAGALGDRDRVRDALLKAGEKRPAVAVAFPGSEDVTVLTIREDFDPKSVGLSGEPEVLALDVTLLHGVILEHVLGIDRAAQEAQTNLRYIKDTGKALDAVRAGEGQVCFLMNATPVSQVRAVSDVGGIMPQKSTFFYPKIASGVVFRSVDPDRPVDG